MARPNKTLFLGGGAVLALGALYILLEAPMQGDPQTSPMPGAQGSLRAFGRSLPCTIEVFEDDPFVPKRPRKRNQVTQICLHESVTHDPDVLEDEHGERDDTTERVLRKRHLGVHLMVGIGPDGRAQVVQHNDLGEVLPHTGKPVNDLSVGIEIVNPYYKNPKGKPWTRSIKAPWAHKGNYTLPLLVQVEAVYQLVQTLWFLSDQGAPGMKIPRRHWGLDGDKFYLKPVKGISKSTPGLLAHHHYGGHADAAWPALYCALRDKGMGAKAAYEAAATLATGNKGVVKMPSSGGWS